MITKSEAIFDVLYIGQKVESRLNDFSQYEIQFFSYLSCLLSLYDGNPLSFWEYSFVKTSLGSPYSIDIDRAYTSLKDKGSISEGSDGYYFTSKKGKSEIDFYTSLHSFSTRVRYLNAACNCLSLIPVGYIKQAIYNEPVLKTARTSLMRRYLLDESSPATTTLYQQFGFLREALKEESFDNLLIPAVVWLEALNKQDKSSNTNEL